MKFPEMCKCLARKHISVARSWVQIPEPANIFLTKYQFQCACTITLIVGHYMSVSCTIYQLSKVVMWQMSLNSNKELLKVKI